MKKQVIVVTGASAGVGRAIACEFAKMGASLGLIARGREGLEGAKHEVESLGGRAVICIADVAREEQLEEAAKKIESCFGPIDIWINNAMVTVFGKIPSITAEEFKRVTEVTYLGSVHGVLVALRRMQPRKRGHIIQIGSALAFRSIPLQSAYCASKHAVHGFIESLRTELIHEKSHIRVSEVHLPALNTPQFDWMRTHLRGHPQPVPPIYQPEVAARAVAFVARRPRREFWVGLPTVIAILSEKIAPAIGDWYLARFGFQSQLAREPHRRAPHDNLFQPVHVDYGARGDFNAQAAGRSAQLFLNMHKRLVLIFLFVVSIAISLRVSHRREAII